MDFRLICLFSFALIFNCLDGRASFKVQTDQCYKDEWVRLFQILKVKKMPTLYVSNTLESQKYIFQTKDRKCFGFIKFLDKYQMLELADAGVPVSGTHCLADNVSHLPQHPSYPYLPYIFRKVDHSISCNQEINHESQLGKKH